MENEKAYKEIINTIIESKVSAFGRLAIDKARMINGLSLNEQGSVVSFSDNPQTVIHNLLMTYEKICGKVSTISARTITTQLRKKYPNLALPTELR